MAIVKAIDFALSPILGPASSHILANSKALQDSPYIAENDARLRIFLAAFIFNLLVVWSACALFIALIDAKSFLLKLGVCGIVASYDVTLAWVWVPHQVIMNVIVPLGGVWAFVEGTKVQTMTARRLAAIGILFAASSLIYPLCVVWPPLLALGCATSASRWTDLEELRRIVMRWGIVLFAFLLPMLAWYLPIAIAGFSVSHEASLGQFSWIHQGYASGMLWKSVWESGVQFAEYLTFYLNVYGLFLAAAVVGIAITMGSRLGSRAVLSDPILCGALATTAVLLLFNFLQGYHRARILLFPLLLLALVGLRFLTRLRVESPALLFCGAVTTAQIFLILQAPHAISQE